MLAAAGEAKLSPEIAAEVAKSRQKIRPCERLSYHLIRAEVALNSGNARKAVEVLLLKYETGRVPGWYVVIGRADTRQSRFHCFSLQSCFRNSTTACWSLLLRLCQRLMTLRAALRFCCDVALAYGGQMSAPPFWYTTSPIRLPGGTGQPPPTSVD